MELAVSIQSIDDIGILHSPWNYERLTEVEQETCNSFYKALTENVGEQLPSRVYFGSEFCHFRLCAKQDLIQAYQMAKEQGIQFSFVTPPLPQSGADRLEELLKGFASYLKEQDTSEKVEIICNDWGVLHYIKSSYSEYFIPVLGRLLNKLIRDPRVTSHYNRADAPRLANTQLKQASYTVHYYREFVRSAGVQTIEFDNITQGLEPDAALDEFQMAIHFNYGCIATGRTCLVGSMHVEKSEKFRGSITCKEQCKHYTAEMVNRHPRIDSLEQRVFQKGNSAFFVQSYEQMKEGLQVALDKKVGRIVYSPRIPV